MNSKQIQKRRGIYMEILLDFLEHKAERIKLSDGYSIITKEYFEKHIKDRIAFPYGPKFIFTGEIKGRIGDPRNDAMDNTNPDSRKGQDDPAYLCGLSFICVYCGERMQLIQHEVNLVWGECSITISIIPKIDCPHCDRKYEIVKSGVIE